MRRSFLRSSAMLCAILFVTAACGGGGTGGGASTTSAPSAAGPVTAVQPTRPVEFVISTAPGGGSDIYARQWLAVMETQKLTPVAVTPVNKEGGAGAVAFTYVFERKGDMHYVMVTLNSFFTTIITNKALPYKATDFTPLANLALDPFFLWVNGDSTWKTAQDFIAAAKERELIVSGTGSKQEDDVLFLRIKDLAGTKPFKFIPQTGGGGVATALGGKQGGVEVTVNNPSEGLGLYQQTPPRIKPLCAFTPQPISGGVYNGLATCKSQGLAIDDYYIMRAVMGPPGLSAGQVKYWEDVLKQVFDSASWKKFMTDNALDPQFKIGADFKKFVDDYNKLHEDIAKKNGWI